MLVERNCPYCQGSGITMVETSSFLGLIKKQLPSNCNNCNGKGKLFEMPVCSLCEGQGLVGNESELCRACNGNGKVDTFSLIPRERLIPGITFSRRCAECSNNKMEIDSGIETKRLTKSWEKEEELRTVELIEQVKVKCPSCGAGYAIPVDENMHSEMNDKVVSQLENLGIDVSFIYDN